jgi:hypothetical protein
MAPCDGPVLGGGPVLNPAGSGINRSRSRPRNRPAASDAAAAEPASRFCADIPAERPWHRTPRMSAEKPLTSRIDVNPHIAGGMDRDLALSAPLGVGRADRTDLVMSGPDAVD